MTEYAPDIKQRVQDLVSTGLSVAEAARNAGVPRGTVRHWVRRAQTATAPARNLLAEKLADDGELMDRGRTVLLPRSDSIRRARPSTSARGALSSVEGRALDLTAVPDQRVELRERDVTLVSKLFVHEEAGSRRA